VPPLWGIAHDHESRRGLVQYQAGLCLGRLFVGAGIFLWDFRDGRR
jgi:hypothetical protein